MVIFRPDVLNIFCLHTSNGLPSMSLCSFLSSDTRLLHERNHGQELARTITLPGQDLPPFSETPPPPANPNFNPISNRNLIHTIIPTLGLGFCPTASLVVLGGGGYPDTNVPIRQPTPLELDPIDSENDSRNPVFWSAYSRDKDTCFCLDHKVNAALTTIRLFY